MLALSTISIEEMRRKHKALWKEPADKVVAAIRRGDDLTLQAVTFASTCDYSKMPSLVAAGLVPACLSRFTSASRTERGPDDGDVSCPHAFLVPVGNCAVVREAHVPKAQTQKLRCEIAGLLGPLLELMDVAAPLESRTIWGSEGLWYALFHKLVNVVGNTIVCEQARAILMRSEPQADRIRRLIAFAVGYRTHPSTLDVRPIPPSDPRLALAFIWQAEEELKLGAMMALQELVDQPMSGGGYGGFSKKGSALLSAICTMPSPDYADRAGAYPPPGVCPRMDGAEVPLAKAFLTYVCMSTDLATSGDSGKHCAAVRACAVVGLLLRTCLGAWSPLRTSRRIPASACSSSLFCTPAPQLNCHTHPTPSARHVAAYAWQMLCRGAREFHTDEGLGADSGLPRLLARSAERVTPRCSPLELAFWIGAIGSTLSSQEDVVAVAAKAVAILTDGFIERALAATAALASAYRGRLPGELGMQLANMLCAVLATTQLDGPRRALRKKRESLAAALQASAVLGKCGQLELSSALDELERQVRPEASDPLPAFGPTGKREFAGCSRCHVQTPLSEIKRCAKCKQYYCSAACQLDDWKNGPHKQECKLRQAAGVPQQDCKPDGVKKDTFSAVSERLFNERHRAVIK